MKVHFSLFSSCYNEMVMGKVYVEEEELTKNYIELVFAPEMGHGIMTHYSLTNTIRYTT